MPFFIKIQPNMSEQEKKWQRIYDLLNTETKKKVSLSTLYKAKKKKKKIQKKELFNEMGEWGIEQKWKEGFLTALASSIKKEPPQRQ